MNNNRMKIAEQLRHQYLDDLSEILDTPEGKRFFGRLLVNMGLFNDVYVTNSTVYKNAALADFARRLTEDMDRIDLQHLVKIKEIILEDKNRLQEGNKEDTEDGNGYSNSGY